MYSQIVLFCRSGIWYYGFLINLWTSHRLSLLVPYHCISVFCDYNAYYLPVAWVTQWRIIISMTVFIADFFSRNQTYYASCPLVYGYYWSFGLMIYTALAVFSALISYTIHLTAAWHSLLSARRHYLHISHSSHFVCLLAWLRQTSLFITLRYHMRDSYYY